MFLRLECFHRLIILTDNKLLLSARYRNWARGARDLRGEVLDFRLLFAYSADGRGNGKRVARRLHCRL